MASEANLAGLAGRSWEYIVGVRLRQHAARRALGGPGRYAKASENLYVKEVSWKDGPPGERLIVCYNPLEAKADVEARMRMVSELRKMGGDGIPKKLLKTQVARRYLKLEGGRVRLDEARIREDRRYDAKWVLRTNCKLPAVEVARHYKGLWQLKQAFSRLSEACGTCSEAHHCPEHTPGKKASVSLGPRQSIQVCTTLNKFSPRPLCPKQGRRATIQTK